jgi:peroxiredoxin
LPDLAGANRDCFPAPLDDGAADHLRSGLALPQGSLSATQGTEVSLAALAGRSVLIIYPWSGRPDLPNPPDWDLIPGAHGSTSELEGFRDHAEEFAQAGVRLLALSRQTTDYQRELVTRLNLPFPILSDGDGRFAAALALPAFTTGGDTYLKRLTLVIDTGRIAASFYPVRDPTGHASELVRWLREHGTELALAP